MTIDILINNILIPTIIAPVVMTAVVYGLLWLIEHKRKSAMMAKESLAIIAGYLTGHVLNVGWSSMSMSNPDTWFAVLAVGLAIIECLRTWLGRGALIVRSIVVLMIAYFYTKPLIENTWNLPQTLLWLTVFVAWPLVLTRTLRFYAAKIVPMYALTIGLGLLTSVSVLIGLAHSALLAQLTGVLCSSLGVLWLLSVLKKRPHVSFDSLATVLATILTSHILGAYFYADFSQYLLAAFLVASSLAPLKMKPAS